MKLMILGNVYSIHTRRWATYLARDHEVYLAYKPKNSMKEVKSIYFKNDSYDIQLLPLYDPMYDCITKWPRYILKKMSYKAAFNEMGLNSLKKYLKEIKPDLLHAHYLPEYGRMASLTGYHPLVLSAWGQNITYIEGENRGPLSKRMFEAADLVFAGEPLAKERLVEFGCPFEIVYVQAWGTDIDNFTPDARSEEFRRQLFGGKEGLIVTFVCSLEEVWKVATLIEAAPLVLSEINNVKFLIIGDGSERGHLEQLIEKHGISDQVKLLGRIEIKEMNTYLASSDLYVDTYYTDKAGGGIGVAVMEAMSSGLPVVAGRRPGVEAGVRDGHNGYLFEGGNPEDMARKMLLLLCDENKRRTFGKKSREIATQIGNWKKNMADVERIYSDLILKYR